MTKVRKLKKKKKYQYHVNRKRMNKKSHAAVRKLKNDLPFSRKSFSKLGLLYDVNQDIKGMSGEKHYEESLQTDKAKPTSSKNVKKQNAGSFKKRNFRFSKDEVDYLTYMLDKYGDDFKAMTKDTKNYLQHTWKQLRYKINLFKSIPDHYNEYLRNKNISTS